MDKFKERDKVTRDELQNECAFIEGHILLEWATRVGKMRAGLKTIKEGETVLILSPTEFINTQWKDNLETYGLEADVMCYASAHKILNKYDRIILDECHHLTDRVFEAIKHLGKHPTIVGLSGTMPRSALRMFQLLCDKFTHWKITLAQAIAWGIIAAPTIYAKGVQLDDTKPYLVFKNTNAKDKPIKYVRYGHHKYEIFKKNQNTFIQCTEFEYLELVEEKLRYFKDQLEDPETKIPNTIIINKLNQLGNMRKGLFANAKNKYIKRIISHFGLEDKRVIFFCNDIPQAEFIDESFAIHSKKAESSQMLEDFNEGKIDKLLSINILNEGVNVYNVDAVVILQVAKSEVRTAQQAARGLLNASPVIITLFYRHTDDEKTVKKFLNPFKPYTQWL